MTGTRSAGLGPKRSRSTPSAGFAVLCGWTALALVVAAYLLRRRDA
jgi:hypothetical protein